MFIALGGCALRDAYRHPDLAEGQTLAERVLDSFPDCPIPEMARLGRNLKQWRGAFLAYRPPTRSTDYTLVREEPRSPWQRGSNENTNRLLRQYLPKQADLSRFTQTDLDRIAAKINTRPRRVLGWDTSHDRLLDALMA